MHIWICGRCCFGSSIRGAGCFCGGNSCCIALHVAEGFVLCSCCNNAKTGQSHVPLVSMCVHCGQAQPTSSPAGCCQHCQGLHAQAPTPPPTRTHTYMLPYKTTCIVLAWSQLLGLVWRGLHPSGTDDSWSAHPVSHGRIATEGRGLWHPATTP